MSCWHQKEAFQFSLTYSRVFLPTDRNNRRYYIVCATAARNFTCCFWNEMKWKISPRFPRISIKQQLTTNIVPPFVQSFILIFSYLFFSWFLNKWILSYEKFLNCMIESRLILKKLGFIILCKKTHQPHPFVSMIHVCIQLKNKKTNFCDLMEFFSCWNVREKHLCAHWKGRVRE
jgi:hypothetical protein